MSMNIKPTNSEETRMNTGIQKAYNALPNAIIGNQTMSEIAKEKCPEIFPLTLEIYSQPMIIARDIIPFNPNGPIENYKNTISGSFTSPYAVNPCSIMIQNGKDIFSYGSKAWAGFKESVIVGYYDGSTRIVRVLNTSEIPDRKNVKWAVGGAGLLGNYDPDFEGFRNFTFEGKLYKHGDVRNKTNHTALGVKDNYKYLMYLKNMSADEMDSFCRDKMMFDMAIWLDGGKTIPAINGAIKQAQINLNQRQGYAIQGI